MQIQDAIDDDDVRDTPPQLSPIPTVSENQSVSLRPPALEAVEQLDTSSEEEQHVKQLPTKMVNVKCSLKKGWWEMFSLSHSFV